MGRRWNRVYAANVCIGLFLYILRLGKGAPRPPRKGPMTGATPWPPRFGNKLWFSDFLNNYNEFLSMYADKHLLILQNTFHSENSPQKGLQLTFAALQRYNSFEQTSLSRVFLWYYRKHVIAHCVHCQSQISHQVQFRPCDIRNHDWLWLQIVSSLNLFTLLRNVEAALVEMVDFTKKKLDFFQSYKNNYSVVQSFDGKDLFLVVLKTDPRSKISVWVSKHVFLTLSKQFSCPYCICNLKLEFR